MPEFVAVSPDILFGQFFGKAIDRHNAEMTPALHCGYLVVPGMQFYQMPS
jgi:hypothetical protein